jgi:hypothetical protein
MDKYLRIVAALLAIGVSSFTASNIIRGYWLPIDPIAIKFVAEKGVAVFEINEAGKAVEITPDGITGAVSLQMTTKAALIVWRVNFREDCFLVNRSAGFRSDQGFTVSLFQETGVVPVGKKGANVTLIPVRIPSDFVAGNYTAFNNETYDCRGTKTTFEYPPIKINIRY